MKETTKMDSITTETVENICDLMNEYNRINNFEQTQSYKLLQKIAELETGVELVSEKMRCHISDSAEI